MRYSIPMKFLAVLLAAVALTAAFIGAVGILQVAELGLYTDALDGWLNNRLEWQGYDLAESLTKRFAIRALTNCSEEFLEELGYWYIFEESFHWTGMDENRYDYSISDAKGQVLDSQTGLQETASGWDYQTVLSVNFPVLVTTTAVVEEIYGKEFLYKDTVYSQLYDNKPVTVRYYESPEYTVRIRLDPDAVLDRSGSSLELIRLVYEQRYTLMVVLAAALVLFAACLVYICCAAGKSVAGESVTPAGLNRLPLDMYAFVGALGGWLLGSLAYSMLNHWIFNMDNLNAGTLVLVGLVILAIALIIVGFVFCLCAQLKAKNHYWWRRSITGWLWKKLWNGLKRLAVLLPAVWQYLLAALVMVVTMTAGALIYGYTDQPWLLLAAVVLSLGIGLYGGYAHGTVLNGAKKMAQGDLSAKIDTRFLLGSYKTCAEHLNALAEVATEAARKQLRSERLKTELITNVSHDIKTPLTSIINYVDLLQSVKEQETARQYLQVLGRQSQRLKKLIEDLMEMSKASTGNLTVDMTEVDPVEAVQQALGEFSDKLEAGQLQTVLTVPEGTVAVRADGRLLWRVLSNLLSNIVKYAMSGTRVYVDVTELESDVLISLKNISREPLNVTAEELTERFVRGDTSRNTEGSGLGLNIAKSLMELQKGQLQLMVDGDLFKATVVLPKITTAA